MAGPILYLLRHGESQGNLARILDSRKLNAPLTAAGRAQAQEMARLLSSVDFAAAHASPLVRARMTAEAVCRPHGHTPVVTDDLLEVDVGSLDGASWDDPDALRSFTEVLARWEDGTAGASFPGGESLDDVRRRLQSLLASLEGPAGSRALAVGHGLLFAAVIWLLCPNRPGTIEGYLMGSACLAVVETDGETGRLLALNVAPDTPVGSVDLP